ncbi:MAG: phosphatidylserine/phosphatidylglycerophosphate/cardiolipin synthase family protein, partial [Firmicutes bacterium]|nr:phosphatidylserine/phosphatidylglycerophosphate/cardiolipin synthase family protein [Bacillota bacterium]
SVAAAKRGVKVRVILDQSPDRFRKGETHNQQIAGYLKANGVEVLTYPPNHVNIDHVKLLIADDNKALIGGMNWGAHSPDNKDADVLIKGNEAAELKRDIFNKDVKYAGGKPDNTVVGPVKDDNIKVLTTSPKDEEGGAHAIRETLLSDINGARKNIYAEMFTLTDSEVVNSLITAHNRGVDVKVILDPNQHSTNQKSYDALKAAGVPVKWYNVNASTKQKLHAKWGVFDDNKTLLGSANWTAQGLSTAKNNRANHEADVEVNDKAANAVFTKTFAADWNNSSDNLPQGLPGPSF